MPNLLPETDPAVVPEQRPTEPASAAVRSAVPPRHEDASAAAHQAAESASDDADLAARSAASTSASSVSAAKSAAQVASDAKAAKAAAVASAAVAVAQLAAAAADVVEEEAVARAVAAAAAAVEALETVAAERSESTDAAEADRAAAAVAATVAAEVIAAENLATAAASTIAAAVAAAAEAVAATARRAAETVEREAALSKQATRLLVDSSAVTAAAADTVVTSTKRVADLAARVRVVAALRDSEQRFKVTFDNAPVGMMLLALGGAAPGRLLRTNPAMRAITGHPEAELLALSVGDLFRHDEGEHAALFAALSSGETSAYELEGRWRHAGGREIFVRASVHAVRDDVVQPAYAVGQVEDVTERRRAHIALQRQEERFRLAFDNAITGMAFVTVDGVLRKTNNALTSFLGRSQHELTARRFDELAAAADQASIRAGIAGVVAGEFSIYQADHCFDHADGRPVWGLLSASLVHDITGQPDYLVVQVKDISSRKEAEQRLAHQALHDDLTGLANRVLLGEHLDLACSRARRSGGVVAVLFIDLDDFKEVNDSLGHVAGDQVLRDIAARLSGCLRADDVAARLGGDEFVVVCEGLHDLDEVRHVVDRIEQSLDEPFVVGVSEVHISVSVGINTADVGADPSELLRGADTAMYHAKSDGKDRYEFYDSEMSVRAVRHVTIASDLAHALRRNELRLHYQPTYDVCTGSIRGLEALLRWQHPTRGLLAPADFLDVAEGRRMMVSIGDWVLQTAANDAARWLRSFGERAPEMWVNIAGQQLGREHLQHVVARTLETTGLPASMLGLEITERQLLGREDSVQGDLAALREQGIRLAIDDFGTGFASLEYLRRFSFDEIKIDRSFISGLGRDRTDTAVTTSVIALGKSLDLTVVAEGVESHDQYRCLRDLGCDLAQGFLMQRPVPADDITALLAGDAAFVNAS